jgi:DNA-binding CsgD family transcriptional regulator
MVKGFANKEIADTLNISIHTVISHRKNITEKTGIKSLSGLTIYAITKKIIPLDYTTV